MVARVIEAGQTPAQVVADLARKGIHISERGLRAKARAKGACRIFGKAMILLPEHVDLLFEAPECQMESEQGSSSTFVDKLGGSAVALRARSDTSAKALEHLSKLSRGRKSGTSRRKPSNVLSLDEMRQSQKSG